MASGAKKNVQYPLRLDSDLWTKINNAADLNSRGVADWMRVALEAQADATSDGKPLPLPEFTTKERAILYGIKKLGPRGAAMRDSVLFLLEVSADTPELGNALVELAVAVRHLQPKVAARGRKGPKA